MIRVLLASASPLSSAGLATLLRDDREIEILGCIKDWPERERPIAEIIEEDVPQVVLIELRLGQERAELRRLFAEGAFSDAAVVLIANDRDVGLAFEAVRLGAKALLPEDVSPGRLRAAIHAAAEGLVVVPNLEETLANGAQVVDAGFLEEAESLTPREREVLNLMASGFGNKEIASKLGISDHTAKFHVASILGKLGAATRTEAVAIGIRNGLVLL
jgi:two-component system, NarL family, response regulator YdfI